MRSDELKRRYKHDSVIISFEWGKGVVYHMISHFYLQRSETRTKKQGVACCSIITCACSHTRLLPLTTCKHYIMEFSIMCDKNIFHHSSHWQNFLILGITIVPTASSIYWWIPGLETTSVNLQPHSQASPIPGNEAWNVDHLSKRTHCKGCMPERGVSQKPYSWIEMACKFKCHKWC